MRLQARGVSMEPSGGAETAGSGLGSYLFVQLTWLLHWGSCCSDDLLWQWLQVGLEMYVGTISNDVEGLVESKRIFLVSLVTRSFGQSA